MALSGKWWILCALSLSCLGSCRRDGQAEGAQPELFIFNELCALKDEPGPCKAIKDRFFFNVDTGHCEPFEYGGCGGNANNFETIEACKETCVVSDDKNPCHLDVAFGPCRGMVKRYFFESTSQECKHFYYGGCFGNANNFRSLAECQARCPNPVKPTEAPEVLAHAARRLAVVQPTEVPEKLALLQPQVQLNYSNQETTEGKHKGVCFSSLDTGTCDGAEKRFFFNSKAKRCQMFHYSGCGGNGNNFMSRKHCFRKCIRNGHGSPMIRIRKKNLGSIVHRSV
ncbi:tissue factor pathway inhibitor a isoform X1 [Hippoglossus hippoglossus]|uniref:tissue factor pathway inhibitor a isoform X1 n=1 Tax=Hippoglossus hippoglossus TaxID=8267 RepID=UPI00148BF4B9|nr:tissue factor pathway inhibitor a isoform X1 [Hippoglossus hippoglossus]